MYYNNNIQHINNSTITNNNSTIVIDKGEQEYNDIVNDINNRFNINVNDMDSLKSMDDDTLVEFMRCYCRGEMDKIMERSDIIDSFVDYTEEGNLSPELNKRIDDAMMEEYKKVMKMKEESDRELLMKIGQLKKDVSQTLHEYTDAYEYALKHL